MHRLRCSGIFEQVYNLYLHRFANSLPLNVYHLIRSMAQWFSLLHSKRKVVNTDGEEMHQCMTISVGMQHLLELFLKTSKIS